MKFNYLMQCICRDVTAIFAALIIIISIFGLISSGCGCTTTVIPKTVESSIPSWDGTNQNSGFIGFEGNSGKITLLARDRYNALIAIYGKRFVPPLTPDYGTQSHIDGNFIITAEALSKFIQMNRWHKSSSP